MSERQRSGRRDSFLVLAGEVAVWWAAGVGVWLLTLSSVTLADSVAAIACSLPCALAGVAGRRAAKRQWTVRPHWLAWLVLLPSAILTDTLRVLALPWRLLLGRTDRPGAFRQLPLPSGDTPAAASHRAWTTLVLSSTPGSFVVDDDPDQRRVTVHSVTPPNRLEQAVGR